MKKPRSKLLKLAKETQKARKDRVSFGVKFRPAVFEDKRKKRKGPPDDDLRDM